MRGKPKLSYMITETMLVKQNDSCDFMFGMHTTIYAEMFFFSDIVLQ